MRNSYTLFMALSLSITPTLALAGPAQVSTRAVAPAQAEHAAQPSNPTLSQTALTRHATSDDDAARYASRDAASNDAKQYRGGDTIVIGASAVAAILAVVLLVVLL